MILELNEIAFVRHARRGLVVRCDQGLAWLTARDVRHGYHLAPGEVVRLRRAHAVVVNGLKERTSVHLSRPSGREIRARRVPMFRASRHRARMANRLPAHGLWSGLNGWARAVGERL